MNNTNAANGNHSKLWTKNYIFLMTANFLLFLGDSLLLPILPFYIKDCGANNFQVGIAISIFFITSILMRIFTSRVSDYLGKRTLLMVSIFVFGLAMLGYYLFAGLLLILLLRLLQGIGFGASTTLYSTAAADSIPYEKMGEGMGYFGLGVTVALALGPCIGAAALSLPNYKWIFLIAALLELITILLTSTIKVDNNRKPVKKNIKLKDFLSDVIEPKALYPAILMLLIGIAMGAYSTYIVLFAAEMNIKNISVYFLVSSLAELFVRLFSGTLYDKKGMNIVVIPGALIGIISCIVMGNAHDLLMISFSAFLSGMSYGMIFPILEASAMKCVTAERRVAANATLYNFLDIGVGLGPLLFGAVVEMSTYSEAFSLSSLVYVALLIIIAAVALLNKKRQYKLR